MTDPEGSRPSFRRPGRWGAALLAALLVAGGGLLHTLRGNSAQEPAWHAWGTDDAYISYRYARSLASGEGLVFNPGEPVEGYSSLIHVLLLAPMWRAAGDDGIYGAAVALNLLCLAAAVGLLAVALPGRDRASASNRMAALALAALCPVLWMTAAMGMETPILLLLQVLLWLAVERAARRRSGAGGLPAAGAGDGMLLAALAALMVLARADGFLMPAAGAAWLALRGCRRAALALAGGLAGTLALLVGWRLAYYGHPLPNTYYLKVSGPALQRMGAGMESLTTIALDSGLAAFLLIWLIQTALSLFRRGQGEPTGEEPVAAGKEPALAARVPPFAACFGLLWCAYFVWVGGDVYRERFLAVLFPLGAVTLARFIQGRTRPALAALVVLLALVAQLRPLSEDRRFAYAAPKYDAWIALGRQLGRAHPGALLAVDAAGKIPFFSGLPTIDMLGLADETIAHGDTGFFRVGHNKSNVEYVLSRHPDLIAVMSQDIDLNYRWGLARSRYEPAGYRLRYLLNCNPVSQGSRDVLDVGAVPDAEVRELIMRGYRYGVLARASASN